MKIAIGSDHLGFRYKEMIKKYFEETGHVVRDFGTFSDDPVDYPAFIHPVAEAVSKGEFDRGVVLGGSGNGEAMVANRTKGVRCALCWNVESALLARKHNDANMVSLGERMISEEETLEIVKVWLVSFIRWLNFQESRFIIHGLEQEIFRILIGMSPLLKQIIT